MSWLNESDYEESPLIENICPHCKAVNIRLDDTTLIEDVWLQESYEEKPNEVYLYSIYECEYCHSKVESSQLNCIYRDDFADMVTDCLPDNWFVSDAAINDDWHQVEISYDLGNTQPSILPTIITIKVTQDGRIDWNQVKEDCIKVNETIIIYETFSRIN